MKKRRKVMTGDQFTQQQIKKRRRLSGLPYYGGKFRMSSRIVNELPPHTVYCEPFVGGASVLFKKGLPPITNTDHYREVINDKDDRLMNLYRQLRDNPRLCELLKLTPHSRSDYNRAREIYEKEREGLQAAWSTYLTICMSFSGIVGAGFGFGVVTRNMGATWVSRIRQIESFIERLQGVTIEQGEWFDVIKRWDSPQTVFYCDPPYPETSQCYNSREFNLADYQDLCDCLDSIKGSFVLSAYAQGIEPDYWKKLTFDAYCSVSGKGKTRDTRNVHKKQTQDKLGNRQRKESLFVVDRSIEAREDLYKILWTPSRGFVYREQSIERVRAIQKTEMLDRIFGD